MVDKNKFFAELDAMNKDVLRHKIHQRAFRKKEVLLLQEWIMQKPDDRNYKTWIRHALYPEKVVTISEAALLYLKGWHSSPHDVFNGVRGKWYKLIIFYRTTIKKFWFEHWKWIITTSIAILALYFSLTK